MKGQGANMGIFDTTISRTGSLFKEKTGKVCVVCKKTFTPAHGHQKYCDASCRTKFHMRGMVKQVNPHMTPKYLASVGFQELRHVCTRCKVEKLRSEFYLKQKCNKKTGLRIRISWCKQCMKDNRKEHYGRYKEQQEVWRLKKQYGMTRDDYNKLLKDQGGTCRICKKAGQHFRQGKPLPLCVDHNHKTGKVRGLLCLNCNSGMGKLGDSIERLKEVIKYLEETDGDIQTTT